ncbi:Crp/Fnr family transcriptional regulator [Terriglobus albidus]|uniref:Crp/Fnr family transcriptional regulator n=1 Tax=Terriglobus albidus TaxID=1592106 RepID=A0A5B9EER8_9BACT|nr:Crp/Fnr family transcriptional regulator [Terriglobus albidus]QEE30259.1 Crp/Fnr family transcriptional regulator [Terriglobus albidus]
MSNCQNCPQAGKHPFCGLGSQARAFLDANSTVVDYPRGASLFHEGTSSDSVYMLCSGRVKITASSSEGKTAILRIASAGDVVGLSAALNKTSYETSAEAIEPCKIRILQNRLLMQLLTQFGDASMAATSMIAQHYRAAFQEIRRIALPDSPAGRVARLILDWAESGRTMPASTITIPLTHEELASMTATTRETVTRTLSRFRREKLIATKGISLTILQPAQLRQLCAC